MNPYESYAAFGQTARDMARDDSERAGEAGVNDEPADFEEHRKSYDED